MEMEQKLLVMKPGISKNHDIFPVERVNLKNLVRTKISFEAKCMTAKGLC